MLCFCFHLTELVLVLEMFPSGICFEIKGSVPKHFSVIVVISYGAHHKGE